MNKGVTVWMTGLPGSGKTTLAKIIETRLRSQGSRVEVFDGDEVRKNLSSDLGFSKHDRELHAKRVAYVSKLLSRNGVVAIVALISPYREFRENARKDIPDFFEVYVKASIDTCAKRDPKGLYKKARLGEIKDLTGPQDPYEEPLTPELVVDTENSTPEEGAGLIISRLKELHYLD